MTDRIKRVTVRWTESAAYEQTYTVPATWDADHITEVGLDPVEALVLSDETNFTTALRSVYERNIQEHVVQDLWDFESDEVALRHAVDRADRAQEDGDYRLAVAALRDALDLALVIADRGPFD